MSSLQAALRVASPLEHDLVRLLVQTNGIIHTMTRGRKYVTLFFGRYEPTTGVLEYVNAGHNAPLLVADGLVRRLAATGRPIGLLPAVVYETAQVVIPPGGMLLLYSDGLTEATNAAEEEFGVERLEAAAAQAAALPAGEVLESVLAAVSVFEDGVEPADDKTAVVLRRR
jgi:sigma-B regulation protein RsbU (phosphoserine phosphatase)